MEDIVWRPSPCPCCDRLREAEEFPLCKNKSCSLFGIRQSVVPEPNTSPIKFRLVPSYQSQDGNLYSKLEDAVAADIRKLLNASLGVDKTVLYPTRIFAKDMCKQPMRSKIMSLLKELE